MSDFTICEYIKRDSKVSWVFFSTAIIVFILMILIISLFFYKKRENNKFNWLFFTNLLIVTILMPLITFKVMNYINKSVDDSIIYNIFKLIVNNH